jgi:small subunit ribosomal protein S19e
MTIIYEIKPELYLKELAEELKKLPEFKMPEWANFVKTSYIKERPPQESDWWYLRAASILRQIFINKIVGVGRLRTRYGGRYNRGVKPAVFGKASGKIIRTILQAAEKSGFLEKAREKRSGRRLTSKGKDFLEKIAVKCQGESKAEKKNNKEEKTIDTNEIN